MSPRTATLPPTEPAMWRKLLAKVHPDSGGDHELFVWTMHLRDIVRKDSLPAGGYTQASTAAGADGSQSDAVSFDTGIDHHYLTFRALAAAQELPAPFSTVLRLLRDYEEESFGTGANQQRRGATYKQLAAIAYKVGMSKAQRFRWYRIAEGIPLSRRHAGHMISKLDEGRG